MDWSGEAVGLMQLHPLIASLDARMKTDSSRLKCPNVQTGSGDRGLWRDAGRGERTNDSGKAFGSK